MPRGFAHVEHWVFDLDNTLYPASCRLFDQMDVKMGEFVSALLGVSYAEAKAVQKQLFYKHGTTLRGLMVEHGINPDGFLDYVHDISYDPVPHSPGLAEALEKLPGRKLIFTNGTVEHARRTMARLGVTHHFEDIFDIVHSDFIPKPAEAPYRAFVGKHGVDPARAAFFEDIARNLEAPHAMGMTTVLVTSDANHDARHLNDRADHTHVDHVTDDLAGFLASLELRS